MRTGVQAGGAAQCGVPSACCGSAFVAASPLLCRGYAVKDEGLLFWPTRLGEALISGYRSCGLDGLWLPNLRGRIEAQIRDVAEGHVSKEQVRVGGSRCVCVGGEDREKEREGGRGNVRWLWGT